MTDLEQAQARILELEEEMDQLTSEMEAGWKSSLEESEKRDAAFYAMVWWRAYAKEWKKDFSRLKDENAALRQERDRLAGIVEKADALAEAYQKYGLSPFTREAFESYQEARHAG